MSAPSTSGSSVELLLRVIDVKYGCFTLLYFTMSTAKRSPFFYSTQYSPGPGKHFDNTKRYGIFADF